MAMYSVLQNGSLIKKVYIPKFIFPMSRVFSSFVTMSFSLGAILIVMLVTRAPLHWQLLLFPLPLILLLLFAMGVSMVLSSLSVYFRDVTHLYGVVTLAWMYVTPVFYPVSALPDEVAWVLKLNPMYYYLDNFRQLVLYGSLPTAKSWCICLLCSGVALAVGLTVFRKLQRNFILYL